MITFVLKPIVYALGDRQANLGNIVQFLDCRLTQSFKRTEMSRESCGCAVAHMTQAERIDQI